MKTVCPLFSDKKVSKSSKITLSEKGEIVADDTKIPETFNTFFSNIIKTLNIEKNEKVTKDLDPKKSMPQNDIQVKILKL